VTTCFTLSGLPYEPFDDSKYLIFQSEGENGDRSVVALPGDAVVGENDEVTPLTVDILKRLRGPTPVADRGAVIGDFGERLSEDDVKTSLLEKVLFVAVDGCDTAEGSFSIGNFGKVVAGLTGLVKTGVSALRNSV